MLSRRDIRSKRTRVNAANGDVTPTSPRAAVLAATNRIFPLYLRERGTEGVREPRRGRSNTLLGLGQLGPERYGV
jgi:hypothetical protein